MSLFEKLFGSSVLDVVVPDTSLEYPPQGSTDDWLARLKVGTLERQQAFFDEQLESLLTVRIDHPDSGSSPGPTNPPTDLLAFLAHLQVALEATYISSVPAAAPESPLSTRFSTPPRSASIGKLNPRSSSHHPSIFPPNTPNPTPTTADHDRRYIRSEGTLLLASIWGQNASDDSREAFSLLWSEKEQVWVAVYKLSVTVSFLRLNFSDPLLCLTVSATLREKPLTLTRPKHPLAEFFASTGGLPTTPDSLPAASFNGQVDEQNEDELHGLEEVNLLEGLAAGPTFSTSGSNRIFLSSARLGTVTRNKLFSLPPVALPSPTVPSPSPITAVRTSHPTLRKSFRKVLTTVSGFRVRMRTVFVPYVLLPESNGGYSDETDDERERREAGNEERTVLLCVEVENSGDSGPGIGFTVEKVDVSIGGEGAKTTLIGWGDRCFEKDAESRTFPLRIGSMAQYNLLYAVSFLRSPDEVEGFSLTRVPGEKFTGPGSELQRAVTINIHGKPYVQPDLPPPDNSEEDPESVLYPTKTFSSRWNCVLDLSANQGHTHDTLEASDPTGTLGGHHNALPEPASPFPSSTPRTAFTPAPGPSQSAGIVPTKRHTLPGSNAVAARSIKSATPTNYRASTSMLNPGHQSARERGDREKEREREREQPPLPGNSNRLSYMPPSISTQIPRSPTTYNPPPPPAPLPIFESDESSSTSPDQSAPPMTPAYPSYPPNSALPPTPMSQAPIASHTSNNVGPSIEVRRERGVGMGNGAAAAVPQTPIPTVMGAFGEQGMVQHLQNAEETGEAIVVSVGLLPLPVRKRKDGKEEVVLGPGKIYPLDNFTVDIFVFNQSGWTRRFEVSCPDRRRRKKGEREERVGGGEHDDNIGKKGGSSPGILPLDNRVRVGPLRPSTCQSVRMDFLAVTPGVHSIDILTLTDVESGYSMNLRNVMDVVVHESCD